MSSILDALKKLEDEKLKESRRRNTDLPLNQAILSEGGLTGSMVQKTGAGRFVMLSVVIVLVGGGFAAWIYSGKKTEKPTAQPPASSRPEVVVTPPPPLIKAVQPLQQEQSVSVKKERPKPVKPPVKLMSAGPDPTAVTGIAVQESPKRPVLRVMGIAYNDSGTNSVAIVNGTPVSVGSQVEGAKVEEILKDKVRFSYGQERFDVMLSR